MQGCVRANSPNTFLTAARSAAKGDLEGLARELARKRPGAAASLREGLEETLTVTKLGITGTLLKSVYSTNPVESMIENGRARARVKREAVA